MAISAAALHALQYCSFSEQSAEAHRRVGGFFRVVLSSVAALQAWVHEMAGYLKEKDPNHLVTVGLEGFWGAHAEEAAASNPLPGENGQLSWTSLTGQNFTAQHDSPHIDFCGAHYWPDLWVCLAHQHAQKDVHRPSLCPLQVHGSHMRKEHSQCKLLGQRI